MYTLPPPRKSSSFLTWCIYPADTYASVDHSCQIIVTYPDPSREAPHANTNASAVSVEIPRMVAATPAQPVPTPPKPGESEEDVRPPTPTPETLARIHDLENNVRVLNRVRLIFRVSVFRLQTCIFARKSLVCLSKT